jgi:hypothetical protein
VRWESVLAWRIERQHLAKRSKDPLGVISDICGLHAQVMSSAQLTLRARVEQAPDVEELLWTTQRLVKTWRCAVRGDLIFAQSLGREERPHHPARERVERQVEADERR